MIKADSFGNEVLSHDVVISDDYKKQLLWEKSWSL